MTFHAERKSSFLASTVPGSKCFFLCGFASRVGPRLQANEVAAVFIAGFHNHLSSEDRLSSNAGTAEDLRTDARTNEPEPGIGATRFPAKWYEGEGPNSMKVAGGCTISTSRPKGMAPNSWHGRA
ncbi:uncharacterized protein J3D65DRAFT_599528 [Phyllosticta citribraziliensis]|uniref:Uncharacterized protein n=1 Tax=Phyllosticta citribraziliensis TaxID=989973 RepID=A0ABR1MAN8_9PEZI